MTPARISTTNLGLMLNPFSGRFDINEIIQESPNGIVARAFHKKLGVKIILKLFRPDEKAPGIEKKRFLREARALSMIRHPSIPRVFDNGEVDGVMFLALELMRGLELGELIKKHGKLSLARTIEVARGLLTALGHIHEAGLLHRDISPRNILVDGDWHVRLIDLGLAGPVSTDATTTTRLTKTGAINGTPHYMPPELIETNNGDARSDIYSAALCIYECLTGRKAVRGVQLCDILQNQINGTIKPPSRLVPGLPESIDAPLMTALEKAPSRRFRTAAAFLNALLSAAGDAASRSAAADEQSLAAAGPAGPLHGHGKTVSLAGKDRSTSPLPSRGINLQIPGYRLLRRIGEGGMGTVYKAIHLGSERLCALKILSSRCMVSSKLMKRWEREISSQERLRHPNLAVIFDSGRWSGFEYFAMEYIEGATLLEALHELGELSVPEVLWVASEMADVLDYIHREGFIHRDIKPANIMVTSGGELKVMDFGLVLTSNATRLTATGELMGTVPYIAPEILLNLDSVCPRTDVYQLAELLYELLCGQKTFSDKDLAEIFTKKAVGQYTPLDSINSSLPPALVALVHQALSPEIEDRPGMPAVKRSIAELSEKLGADPGDLTVIAGRAAGAVDSFGGDGRAPGAEGSSFPPQPRSSVAADSRIDDSSSLSSSLSGMSRSVLQTLKTSLIHPFSGGLRALFPASAALLLLLFVYARIINVPAGISPSVTVESGASQCRLSIQASPGSVFRYRLFVNNRCISTGECHADDRGCYSHRFSALGEGSECRLVIECEDGRQIKRTVTLPTVKFIDGPYIRTGPTWITVHGRLNVPAGLNAEIRVMDGRRLLFSVERESSALLCPVMEFRDIPPPVGEGCFMELTISFEGRQLMHTTRRLGFQNVFSMVRPSGRTISPGEKVRRFYPSSNILLDDGILYAADSNGNLYAVDVSREDALTGERNFRISWLWRGSPGKYIGLFIRKPFLYVCAPGDPCSVTRLHIPTRISMFSNALKKAGKMNFPQMFDKRGGEISAFIKSLSPLSASSGERVFRLATKASKLLHSSFLFGKSIFLATSDRREKRRFIWFDTDKEKILMELDIPGRSEFPPLAWNNSIIAFLGLKPGQSNIIVYRQKYKKGWNFGFDSEIIAPPAVDPAERYIYVNDGRFIYRLLLSSPFDGAKEIKPELGEWKIPARDIISTPCEINGRLWCVAKRRFAGVMDLLTARCALVSFRPDDPLASRSEHPGGPAGDVLYRQVRFFDLRNRGGTMYFCFGKLLYAFNTVKGKPDWMVSLGRSSVALLPAVHRDVLYIANRNSEFLKLYLPPSSP